MNKSQLDMTVFIDSTAYAKLRLWVKLADDNEVSCLGLVDEIITDDRISGFIVSEIYLLEQTVSGAETEFDDKAVADLMIQLADEGIDTSQLKCWIHSHSTMKTFWSGTDEECCSMLANNSYSVSIVTNLRGDILTRLDIYKPFRATLDNVHTQIHSSCPKELEELYAAEFKAKVKSWKMTGKQSKRFQPFEEFKSEEELELAFERGEIDMFEYQQLTGQTIIFDEF